MTLVTKRGAEIPFFVEDFTYEDIRTADFDPITDFHDARNVHPAQMNASEAGAYSQHGFLVRPDTDGALYCITWKQYVKNGKSVAGLTPQKYIGSANAWIEVPLAKVFAKSDVTYPSTSDYINVAPLV